MAEAAYYDRMSQASALSDKTRIIWHIPTQVGQADLDNLRDLDFNDHILDVGAGSGELAEIIANATGATVHAVESDPDALALLRKRKPANGDIIIHEMTISDFFARTSYHEYFAAVVFSSVLHEIWSDAALCAQRNDRDYGRPVDIARAEQYAWDTWDSIIQAAEDGLMCGGRIIVRDGVKPEYPYQFTQLTALNGRAGELLGAYAQLAPHSTQSLKRDPDNALIYTGTAQAVAEAVLTLNWAIINPDGFEREVRERYMLHSRENGIRQIIGNRPLHILTSEAYVQDEYKQVLDHFVIHGMDERGDVIEWFPYTNAVWVFEKRI